MIGYCEACRRESTTSTDEYGVECCKDCGNDIAQGVHVESDYEDDYNFDDEE